MMEFRLWSEPLNETAFDNHVSTPKSYFGNTVSSSYDNLSRRFQFDDNSGLAQNSLYIPTGTQLRLPTSIQDILSNYNELNNR